MALIASHNVDATLASSKKSSTSKPSSLRTTSLRKTLTKAADKLTEATKSLTASYKSRITRHDNLDPEIKSLGMLS